MSSIAVIGSGIAGLTAAWALSRAGWRVTLMDRHPVPGMDARGVHSSDDPDSRRIDVPVRMFHEGQWPELCELYSEIGVETVPVDGSRSFSVLGQPAWLTLESAWHPNSLLSLIASRRGRTVVREARRLFQEGQLHLDTGCVNSISLREYLESQRYSEPFRREFLYPTLSSTVCTCSYRALDEYPASVILGMLRNLTSGRGLLRTRLGTRDVVERLLEPIDKFVGGERAASVTDTGTGVQVDYGKSDSITAEHAVIAVQANHAATLLDARLAAEFSMLGTFRYETVQVVVHRDESIMPARRRDWRTLNMVSRDDLSAACCSIWLNRFYGSSLEGRDPLFQTIWAGEPNDFPVNRSTEIARQVMQRPVVRDDTATVLDRLKEREQRAGNRIWFCGSYAAPGLPLLESGVVSAKSVASRIGRPRNRI